MGKIKKEYGNVKGKRVYYALENKFKKEGKLRSMLAQAKKHHDLS